MNSYSSYHETNCKKSDVPGHQPPNFIFKDDRIHYICSPCTACKQNYRQAVFSSVHLLVLFLQVLSPRPSFFSHLLSLSFTCYWLLAAMWNWFPFFIQGICQVHHSIDPYLSFLVVLSVSCSIFLFVLLCSFKVPYSGLYYCCEYKWQFYWRFSFSSLFPVCQILNQVILETTVQIQATKMHMLTPVLTRQTL